MGQSVRSQWYKIGVCWTCREWAAVLCHWVAKGPKTVRCLRLHAIWSLPISWLACYGSSPCWLPKWSAACSSGCNLKWRQGRLDAVVVSSWLLIHELNWHCLSGSHWTRSWMCLVRVANNDSIVPSVPYPMWGHIQVQWIFEPMSPGRCHLHK